MKHLSIQSNMMDLLVLGNFVCSNIWLTLAINQKEHEKYTCIVCTDMLSYVQIS